MMRHRSCSRLSAGCLLLLACPALAQAPLPPPPPPPPPPPAAAAPAPSTEKKPSKPLSEMLTGAAKQEYNAGKLLYGDGDYGSALVKFENAYEQSKEPKLLWNMAACEKNLRHYARVLKLLQRYQQTGEGTLTVSDRKEADELAAVARSFVSQVRITVNEPHAAVTVDNVDVGASPIEGPILLDMGTRTIRVSKTGFREWSQTQKISGTSELLVAAELVAEVRDGRLLVSTASTKDMIFLDGKAIGEGHWEGKVPSGGHTLRVVAPGMRAYQQEVLVKENELRSLQVTLEPDTSKGSPTVLLLSLGGALLAGTIAGSYFLFKQKDELGQSPITGTITPGPVQLSYRRIP